jgi:CMP-N-acetylneuraminic acid synthetase/phosphoglycolate phosphatase-like HAD superfamily hydrolase
MKISAFVPIKLHSRRLPNKNFLRLGDRPLSYYIFDTLIKSNLFNKVYCYSSTPEILELLPQGIELLYRPSRLDGDEILANELFAYAVDQIDAEIICLAHATAPFISVTSLKQGFTAVQSEGFDSAFTVSSHKTYAWYNGKELNFKRENIAQTQNLSPVKLETSGFYYFRKDDYLKNGTRIGSNPCMIDVNMKESIDIDYLEDFKLAKCLLNFDDSVNPEADDRYLRLLNKFQLEQINHIIFDLDGVLINSLDVMKNSWSVVVEKFNLDIPFSEYQKHIGKPFFDILNELRIDLTLAQDIQSLYDEISTIHMNEIVVYSGVIESLVKLSKIGYKISVVTSKSKDRTSALIKLLFSDRVIFDSVVSPEDIPSGRGKPSPDGILLASILTGIDPSNAIYIGDMQVDSDAAIRAGVQFIYAGWGYGKLDKNLYPWFRSMEDLSAYLELLKS